MNKKTKSKLDKEPPRVVTKKVMDKFYDLYSTKTFINKDSTSLLDCLTQTLPILLKFIRDEVEPKVFNKEMKVSPASLYFILFGSMITMNMDFNNIQGNLEEFKKQLPIHVSASRMLFNTFDVNGGFKNIMTRYIVAIEETLKEPEYSDDPELKHTFITLVGLTLDFLNIMVDFQLHDIPPHKFNGILTFTEKEPESLLQFLNVQEEPKLAKELMHLSDQDIEDLYTDMNEIHPYARPGELILRWLNDFGADNVNSYTKIIAEMFIVLEPPF